MSNRANLSNRATIIDALVAEFGRPLTVSLLSEPSYLGKINAASAHPSQSDAARALVEWTREMLIKITEVAR